MVPRAKYRSELIQRYKMAGRIGKELPSNIHALFVTGTWDMKNIDTTAPIDKHQPQHNQHYYRFSPNSGASRKGFRPKRKLNDAERAH
jgi:hypothetical protein